MVDAPDINIEDEPGDPSPHELGEIRRDIEAEGFEPPGASPGRGYKLEELGVRDLTVSDSASLDGGRPAVQVRAHDPALVTKYVYAFRRVPPIEVLDVDGELLVADGFHRLRAAERLGLRIVRAWVKKGSYQEALDRAVLANLDHGEPFRGDTARTAAIRLHAMWPKASNREISTRVGVSHTTVDAAIAVDALRKEAGLPGGNMLPFSVGREVVKAPEVMRGQLANLACDSVWTAEQARLAVTTLRNPATTEEARQALLSGQVGPDGRALWLPAAPKPKANPTPRRRPYVSYSQRLLTDS